MDNRLLKQGFISGALSLLLSTSYTVAFSCTTSFSQTQQTYRVSQTEPLHLVPLSKFSDDITFLSKADEDRCCFDSNGCFKDGDDVYQLALVEKEDLPDMCRFVVAAFGAAAISLSKDLNSFEQLLLSPATELLNSYSSVVAFAEVFSGTQQRLETRLSKMDVSPPDLKKGLSRQELIDIAEKDSIILAVGKKNEDSIDFIASIELRLQPSDAKIPFSLPWLDRIERRIAATVGIGTGIRDLQPYLSNLCVAEDFRGKKIGRGLVRCVEDIALSSWGMPRMYLHVDEDNVAALSLYKSEGYRDVGHRWNPFWAGSSANIGYYVKTLKGNTSSRKQ
ncbi:unnamed protein product [Cylindrotheca closterium]|uniref:N-acetyltransferase domain-containing protein n=1 Tax=Cylindrotheca closterium TaxID=2856 RepID=A0AAD2FVU3_9STRA|nr:unnamed protein product [Cylindrotheca closterium]